MITDRFVREVILAEVSESPDDDEEVVLPTLDDRRRLRELLSALSRKECLLIFGLASRGTLASIKNCRRHGVLREQFNDILKRLTELGLLTRDETRAYRHTPLGSLVYQNQAVTLARIYRKNSPLEIMNRLEQKNRPSTINKRNIMRSALSDMSRQELEKLEAAIGLSNLKPIRFFRSIDEYDSYVAASASRAKSNLYLATRSLLDLGPIETILGTLARRGGKKINVIVCAEEGDGHPPSKIFERLYDLEATSSSRKENSRKEGLQADPNVSIHWVDKIPCSFFVADDSVAIGIGDPDGTKSFYAGWGLQSNDLKTRLISYCDGIAAK